MALLGLGAGAAEARDVDIGALIDKIRDPKTAASETAVRAREGLSKAGAAAVPSLLELARKSQDMRVLLNVLIALSEIDDQKALRPAVNDLAVGAGTGPFAVRYWSIKNLGLIGDSRALKPLVGILDDPDELLRAVAAIALGVLGNRDATTPLLTVLGKEDEDADVRMAALEGVGTLWDQKFTKSADIASKKAVVEKMVPLLGDRGITVRGVAVVVLSTMLKKQDDATAEPLVAALMGSGPKEVKLGVAKALSTIYVEKVLPLRLGRDRKRIVEGLLARVKSGENGLASELLGVLMRNPLPQMSPRDTTEDRAHRLRYWEAWWKEKF